MEYSAEVSRQQKLRDRNCTNTKICSKSKILNRGHLSKHELNSFADNVVCDLLEYSCFSVHQKNTLKNGRNA